MGRKTTIIVGSTIFVTLLTIGTLWWYFDLGHRHVEKLPWLHDQALATVLTELGEPDRKMEYTIADSPNGEFRVELYNTYPPNDPIAKQARILELQWHHVRYKIAVWLHQVNGNWVVQDPCRWKEGVVF